ncbi:MAG: tRNA lysidine(34) synthetase TilS [Nitrospirota bacterium]|nr:tRNA lysidine(34) synthetase TilS [Nitrospirota bacterium]
MSTPPRYPLHLRLRATLAAHPPLLPPGGRVLVALSGGLDSVVLLHLLVDLAPLRGVKVSAAHLHHGLRGAEADRDQSFCVGLCARLGVKLMTERREVRRQSGESPHTAARRVRHAFLREAAAACGAERIATAHHADDQGETMLLRLASGTGSGGLSGMARQNGPLIRPLLGETRAALEQYAREHGLTHVEDSSNRDQRYPRGRIRHQVMPVLRALNPAIATTLSRTAGLLADDHAWLEEAASGHYAELARPIPGGLRMDAARLASLPPALARRVLRRALGELAGRPPHLTHVEALRDLFRKGGGRHLDLPGGVRADARSGSLWLTTPGAPATQTPNSRTQQTASAVPLQVPGETPVPWAGLAIEARTGGAGLAPDDGWVWFDVAAFSGPLVVRSRRPGDRFCPAGMGGRHKKLQDYFIDTRVPRPQRDRVPLVEAPEGLLWVVGMRQDARFMVKNSLNSPRDGHLSLALRTRTLAP